MQHFVTHNCIVYGGSERMSVFTYQENDIIKIYTKYVDMVYRICFMYMKNKADAEDATQNTFIKLIQKKPEFENEEHEKAWLIVTATNLCKNYFKHWWRKNIDISLLEEPKEEILEDRTLKILLKLPKKWKKILYLYYYEGYKTEEIARMLHIKPATIRSQLQRGRMILKDWLESEEL